MVRVCLSKVYETCIDIKNIPESYARKILRLCVFQRSENAGLFERTLVKIYIFFSQWTCFSAYDPNRAKRGWELLQQLGAKSTDIRAEKYLINAMEWDPKELEKKIYNLGGSWNKCRLINGQTVLAIRPPENVSQEWKALELKLLKFWPKKEGKIITCASADEVKDVEKLVVQINSTRASYGMMRKKMALYVGCKAKIVCFDPPGTALSKGIATEGAYYTAIKAVYDRFANSYSPENTWVAGACLACTSAAYLRSQVPNVNVILENGFVDLKEDMAKPEGRLVYGFVKRYWDALFDGDIKESGFDIAKMWKIAAYPFGKNPIHSDTGKMIIVSVENDPRVSKDVKEKLIKIAREINREVIPIEYRSPTKDPHSSYFETNEGVLRKVLHCIFE